MQESCKAAGERVRAIRAELGDESERTKETVYDVPASFDASWSKRGHDAHDAVIACIAEETSQVLDAVLLSNNCPQCTSIKMAREEGKMTFLDYLKTYAEHEADCLVNHEGSAQVW